MLERSKVPRYPQLLRGEKILRDCGELAYETRPWDTAPHLVTFLEWHESPDERMTNPWYARVVNKQGRIEAVHSSLIYPQPNNGEQNG